MNRSRSRSPRQRDAASGSSVRSLVEERSLVVRIPFITTEGLATAQAFKASTGDVFISTYPKTGTTWLQQICHQLRTGGHTDFDEITEEGIVPWLEVGPSLLQDISHQQMAKPRVFKTHQTLSRLAHLEDSGARYLCTLRDPETTLLSFFKFELGHNAPCVRSRDINVWLNSGFVFEHPEGEFKPLFGASIWEFYAEFWRCRNLPNVMLLVFEDLKDDLDSQLDDIARFIGAPTPSADRPQILEYCSMKWMSQNDHLFDDHFIVKRLEQRDGKNKHFRMVPKVGHEIQDQEVNLILNETSRDLLKQLWKDIVEPVSGHSSYADMITELRKDRLAKK